MRNVVLAAALAAAACSDSTGPPDVPPGAFESVAGGFEFSCALLGAGGPFCWGNNSNWQLGTGNLNTRDSLPRPVAGGRVFETISSGRRHACGLTLAGAAFCWGFSDAGSALGSDTTNLSATPVPVDGGHVFKTITGGLDFTCALTTAGAAYCWGANDWGQLGDDTLETRTPVPVGGGLVFTAIAAGDYHTCGIAVGGAAYCWGNNMFGTLGTGDTATRARHPLPEPVAGGRQYKSIDAGNTHTCAVATNGDGYCWGANWLGQLGTGNKTDRRIPGRVAMTGSHPLSKISVGTNHSCGLDVDGRLWCWGSNGAAQLGATPTETCVYGPGPTDNFPCTTTPLPVPGMYFRNLGVGGFHTCAIQWSGGAFCWGGNTQGQVGNGQVGGNVAVPARVTDPVVIAPVS